MVSINAPTFPVDGLITCASCGNTMVLNQDSQPRYVCQSPCDGPSLNAEELNLLVLKQATQAIITKDNFSDLREMDDPQALLGDTMKPYTENLLHGFIDHVEATDQTATILYIMPLPGQVRQAIDLPGPVTA